MTTSVPFSFSSNQVYSCKIGSQIVLKLERKSDSVAMLLFTDDNDNILPIPKEIVVYTYTSKMDNKSTIQTKIHPNYYALCWTDRYDILYKGVIILSTETTRSWNLVCPST